MLSQIADKEFLKCYNSFLNGQSAALNGRFVVHIANGHCSVATKEQEIQRAVRR